jgi:hypothetical protein
MGHIQHRSPSEEAFWIKSDTELAEDIQAIEDVIARVHTMAQLHDFYES